MIQYCTEVPDSDYEAMQHFVSNSPWEDDKLLKGLRIHVCQLIGDANDAALVLDESGVLKQGKMSVGVSRQYCGRVGKVDNCQVGVYLAYANGSDATLVDRRLYLPDSWISDSYRRKKCKVPKDIKFQTKAQLGLEMILAFKAEGLPFGWVNMDAHYGEQPWLLKRLTDEKIIYMADIGCDTPIFPHRPQTEVPKRQGNRGRHPTKEKLAENQPKPVEVRAFVENITELDWHRQVVRETERGWLIADFAAVRVWHWVDNLPYQQVWLLLRRLVGGKGVIRHAFSNAPTDTSLEKLAAMQCRRYWVERALEEAKSEAGLSEYQVRGWRSWHHHMTMTCLAMLFRLQMTIAFREKASMLTIQDAREILEEFLPRKSYSKTEFIERLTHKHTKRLSARRSHAKKQKQRLYEMKS